MSVLACRSCTTWRFSRFVSSLLSDLARIISWRICRLLLEIILLRMRCLNPGMGIGGSCGLCVCCSLMRLPRVNSVHWRRIGMNNRFLPSSWGINSFYLYHPSICRWLDLIFIISWIILPGWIISFQNSYHRGGVSPLTPPQTPFNYPQTPSSFPTSNPSQNSTPPAGTGHPPHPNTATTSNSTNSSDPTHQRTYP